MSISVAAVGMSLLAGVSVGAYWLTRDTLRQYDLPPGQLFSPADDKAKQVSAKAIAAINARL
ncbi:hypothetical protein N9J84_05800, partial [Porticoccaceae bacterium]|nr:hypothetical protein [Porticoccaceae bacterium]